MIGRQSNNFMLQRHEEPLDESAMAFAGFEHKNCEMQVYLSIGQIRISNGVSTQPQLQDNDDEKIAICLCS